jgi:hypothetical protein
MLEPEIIPIKIRDTVIVRVANLPYDLTRAEAYRISNVLEALAKPLTCEPEVSN